MRKTLATLVVACMATSAMASLVVPMDQQYNVGRETAQMPGGDAIYDPFSGTTFAFMDDGPGTEGFRRQYLFSGAGAASWSYAYLDFYLAGLTNDWVDMSAAPTIEFDARFYQDAVTNTDPYGDAPIFLRLYTYTEGAGAGSFDTLEGYRDYSIVWATQAPWSNPQYPVWSTAVVDPNSGTTTNVAGGGFDLSKISRLRFYSTDWAGQGDDFIDIKNFTVTPEPASLVLIALGGAAVLRRRR